MPPQVLLAQVLWNSTRALPLALAIGLAVVAAVVWLYPPQVKDLPRRWRLGLPALRAAAALALAASLLKPAVLRPKTVLERPAVIVLVDRSRSMSVTDNARTPAQLVALADGLGRLPGGARSEVAAALAADLARAQGLVDAAARARGDWEYARVSGRGVEAARKRADDAAARAIDAARPMADRSGSVSDARLRDALASLRDVPNAGNPDEAGGPAAALRPRIAEALAAARQAQEAADAQLYQSNEAVRRVCDELSKMSRFQLVGQALLRPSTGLLATVGGRATVIGFTVADEPLPVPLATAATDADAKIAAEPDGKTSNLAGAVRTALNRVVGREVAAVVFFSDGRQVGGEGAVTAGLGAAGVPVFAVAASSPGATRDVSFANVSLPASAFIGETVTVRAELRPLGMPPFATELGAKIGESDQPLVIQPLTAQEGRAPAGEFRLRLDRPGAQRITLAVKPVTGEATAENNSVSRWVKVLSQKVKVAAFAGSPTWDFQYLRNALSRSGWVELQAGVLRPGEAARLPLTPQQILDQDVLVFSDVPAAALDQAQWDAVYRLVAERGGSAVLVAGESHLPAEYSQRLVTANLLPYPPEQAPTWRLWPGEQPLFRLAPDPGAADKPFLRLSDDEAGGGAGDDRAGLERWQALPGFYRFLPIGRLKATATPLLIEIASGAPVLTETRVGAGRSFLFGANETWRWRLKAGERDQDRFWLGLVRHAAGEPYAVRSERLAMDLDKVAIEAGETVRVRVRVVGADGLAPASGGHYRVEVVRDGKVVQSLPLGRGAGPDVGRLEARLGNLAEGDYIVRTVAGTAPAGPGGGVELPLHVGSTYEAELADVSGDDSVLRRLAEASGGEFFSLDQMDRLADRLRLAAERRPRYVEQRLWDSPLLFAFVVGCLAAEWAARKRVGLA